MDISTLKGALKSKTVWWNILLALLASLELFAGHLTVLFGQSVASAVLLLGCDVESGLACGDDAGVGGEEMTWTTGSCFSTLSSEWRVCLAAGS
jgi:hypothetical protein